MSRVRTVIMSSLVLLGMVITAAPTFVFLILYAGYHGNQALARIAFGDEDV